MFKTRLVAMTLDLEWGFAGIMTCSWACSNMPARGPIGNACSIHFAGETISRRNGRQRYDEHIARGLRRG